ncbi:MAG: hypothetical protein RIC55_20130 [Pirellulaceae bacterium]
MKTFVCFTLEGLRRQGPHAVWIRLGGYPTIRQAADDAAARRDPTITETRILPYFRVAAAWEEVPCVAPQPRVSLTARASHPPKAATSSLAS